ncbi:MAG: hypothetical protein AB1757_07405 [Acidobacteriota bacterium]
MFRIILRCGTQSVTPPNITLNPILAKQLLSFGYASLSTAFNAGLTQLLDAYEIIPWRLMYTQQELTELFQKLGAPDPELWAASQIQEGINQLGRFLFLRQAWRQILDESDHTWIQSTIEESKRNPGAPYSGSGPALERLLQNGADPQDLTDVVRGMQSDLLFRICYLLSDPQIIEPELQDIHFGLFQLDEDGRIGEAIDGLHESVLHTDPTGREMRPRGNGV